MNRLDNAVIFTKGWVLLTNPMLAVFSGGLSQLKMDSIFGVPKELVELMCAAVIAGQSGLLAFISTSFSTFAAANRAALAVDTTAATALPSKP